MDEVWRSVPSLDGVQASSLGRILLPPRTACMPRGRGVRNYIPKPTYGVDRRANKNAHHVYKGIYSKFYGNIKIHQAVCEAFHGPKPFDGAVVIHLDEDGTNNRQENLRWGTQKENLNMPKVKKYHKSRVGDNSPRAKHASSLAAIK